MKNALSALGLVVVLFIFSRDKSMRALILITLIGLIYFGLRVLKDYMSKKKKGENSDDRNQ